MHNPFRRRFTRAERRAIRRRLDNIARMREGLPLDPGDAIVELSLKDRELIESRGLLWR